MEIISGLWNGFAVALAPINLWWCFVGVFLGTVVGIMPGLGPPATIAMLLPLTFQMPPASAMIMLAGIYYGAKYGGSTTSILLNTPGETASMVTAMEGNKMAKAGRAGPALSTAAIGSFVAGTIATVLLTLLAPIIAGFALQLGPVETFSLMMLTFAAVSAVLGNSPLKGFIALMLGLAIGLIGIEPQSGQSRFTFGLMPLIDGIDIVVIAMGLFAIGETLYTATYENKMKAGLETLTGSFWMSKQDWKRSWKPWLRGTAIGFPFGTIPAGGSEIPTFLSYATERKLSRRKDEFGRGAIEGVAVRVVHPVAVAPTATLVDCPERVIGDLERLPTERVGDNSHCGDFFRASGSRRAACDWAPRHRLPLNPKNHEAPAFTHLRFAVDHRALRPVRGYGGGRGSRLQSRQR